MPTKCFLVERNEDLNGWKRLDNGEFVQSIYNPPLVGAMWYEPDEDGREIPYGSPEWKSYPLEERLKGHLHVMTPGGAWNMDVNASTASNGWRRCGTAPNITATPSINILGPGGWHGWLKDGLLIQC